MGGVFFGVSYSSQTDGTTGVLSSHTRPTYTRTQEDVAACAVPYTQSTHGGGAGGSRVLAHVCLGWRWVDGVGLCSHGSRWTKKDSGGDDE